MPEDVRSKSRVVPVPKAAGSKPGKPTKLGAGKEGGAKKRPSIFRDPLVRTMGIVAVGLVIAYLVFIISGILVGVLASDQPQTAAERDLTVYKKMIDAGVVDEQYWAGYALALTNLGQYGRAQDVLDDAAAKEVGDPRIRALYTVQAELYFQQGEYQKAVDTGKEGMKLLEDQLTADQKAVISGGEPTALTATGLPDSYWEMAAKVGEAYEALGQDEDALEIISYNISNNPTASDLLEWRGDIYVRLGKTTEAVADWTEAIRFLGESDDVARVQDKIDGAK